MAFPIKGMIMSFLLIFLFLGCSMDYDIEKKRIVGYWAHSVNSFDVASKSVDVFYFKENMVWEHGDWENGVFDHAEGEEGRWNIDADRKLFYAIDDDKRTNVLIYEFVDLDRMTLTSLAFRQNVMYLVRRK